MEAVREKWTDERLDDLNGKVDDLGHRMELRFDSMERRFDAMDRRFDSMMRFTMGTFISGFVALATLIVAQG
jgi:hypothetical protein